MDIFDPLFALDLLSAVRAIQTAPQVDALSLFFTRYGGFKRPPFVVKGTLHTPPFFVGDVDDVTIFGCSGVQNAQQFLDVYWGSLSDIAIFQGVHVNATILASALVCYVAIQPWLPKQGKRIIVGGFSIGGAVAEVLALVLVNQGYPLSSIQVCSLGSPRPGWDDLEKALGSNGVRWMDEDDPVPYFPPHTDEGGDQGILVASAGSGDWNKYVHPFIGRVLLTDGSSRFAALPLPATSDVGIRLLDWATGRTTGQHNMGEYARRLLLNSVKEPAFVVTTQRDVAAPPEASVNPNAAPYYDSRSTILSNFFRRVPSMAAYIPLAHRAKVVRLGPGLYVVNWEGLALTSSTTRSNAKAVAKWVNKMLRTMGTTTGIVQSNFHSALTAFLAFAKTPGSGFIPLWNVL